MSDKTSDRTALGTKRKLPKSEGPELAPIPPPPPLESYYSEAARRRREESSSGPVLRCATPEEEAAFRERKEAEAAKAAAKAAKSPRKAAKSPGKSTQKRGSGSTADDQETDSGSQFSGGRKAESVDVSPSTEQPMGPESQGDRAQRKTSRRGVIGGA